MVNVRGSGDGFAVRLVDLGRKGMRHRPGVEDVSFNGKPLPERELALITAAELDMGVDQVADLVLTFDDPGFDLLRSGRFDLETPVTYRGLELYVAVLESTEGGGLGGTTVHCRPRAVKRLKNLQGKRVLHDLTPGEYIKSECKKAKIKRDPFVQKAAKKKRIARDTPEKDTTYDGSSEPSAWTTMKRIANEKGYLLYEVGGTIVFGQPTWLVKNQPKIQVDWYRANGNEPYTIPQIRQSVDSEDVEVSLEIAIERAGDIYPGVGIQLNDFPRFAGTYFVNNVTYPLIGEGNISIQAATVRNPEPASTTTSSLAPVGEWVEDADKRGINCKYTPRQMVERAYTYLGQPLYSGYCQKFVDILAKGGDGGGAANGSAEWAYMPAGTQHSTNWHTAPAGSVLCWSNPHTAIGVGNGKMITTTGSTIQKRAIDSYVGMSSFLGWKYPNLV